MSVDDMNWANPLNRKFILIALALVWGLRMAVGVFSEGPIHPDEIFQYYEQAYRLVHGYGVIPWEFDFGIRSWLLPLVIAGPLWLAQAVGLDAPWQYDAVIKAVFSVISLSAPVGMYLFARAAFDPRAGVLAFGLGCIWHTLLHFADTPMPSILAGYGFLWAGILFLRPGTVRAALGFGVLCGLILVVRYQMLPAVGVLALCYLWRERNHLVLWAGLAFGLVVLGAGLLDVMFWGGFLFSFTNNFVLNFTANISAVFGVNSLFYFAKELLVDTWGLIVPAGLGLLLAHKRAWPVLIAGLVGVAFFHVPGHKEFRFIVWAMPIILVGLAAACVWLWDHPTLAARTKRAGLAVLIVWAAALNGAKLAGYIGQPFHDITLDEAQEQAFYALAQSPDLTGLKVHTPGLPWWRGLGYYGLGRPVPIEFTYWHERTALRPEEISHMLTQDPNAPQGFAPAARFGPLYLWAKTGPSVARGLEGYDLSAPYPAASLDDLAHLKPCMAYGLRAAEACDERRP